jgi:hypothetical protein
MNNKLTAGDIINDAAKTTRKRYLPQLAMAAVARVLFLFFVGLTVVGALVYMDNMDTSLGTGWDDSMTVMGVAAAVIYFIFHIFDAINMAVASALASQKTGAALLTVLKRLHLLVGAALLGSAMYFIFGVIVFVMFGLLVMQFSVTTIASLMGYGVLLAIALLFMAVAAILFLLTNNTLAFLIPPLIEDRLPLLACMDIALKSAFKRGRIIRLTFFNGVCKLFAVLVFGVTFIAVNSTAGLPDFFYSGIYTVDTALSFILNTVITYMICVLFVPIHKNIIRSFKLMSAEHPPQNYGVSGAGARIAAVLTDAALQFAVLSGLLYGAARFMGRNNPDFVFSLNIGILPLLTVMLIIAGVLTAVNYLIYKMADGKFVGKRIMGIGLSGKPK